MDGLGYPTESTRDPDPSIFVACILNMEHLSQGPRWLLLSLLRLHSCQQEGRKGHNSEVANITSAYVLLTRTWSVATLSCKQHGDYSHDLETIVPPAIP